MWPRVVSILLAFVVPGGFPVLLAWVFARAVRAHMEADSGPRNARFSRAVASLRWADLVRQARQFI